MKNSDGSCAFYIVKSGDDCDSIATSHGISVADLVDFNNNGHSYNWEGCDKLAIGQGLCLSEGTPPKPECGPYAPGDWKTPPECPNKACCSKWGYCGLTSDFCEKSTGCFSNCGYGNIPSRKPSNFKRVAYWLDNDNGLYYPIEKIASYDLVHYSFATINEDMTISVGSNFRKFLDVNAKKIIAFGGWDFSTSSSTYNLFRTAISSGREQFATNLVEFMDDYDLDGFHFDWEYPGQIDIPGIPAGSNDDGENYNELFKLLAKKAPKKLKSIALPASYWYLKGYPLSDLEKNMDYFVLMNYDYVGQWDYGKPNMGLGCHNDRLITEESIKMIQKSGIDTTKVYGGLANYGRSFKLKDKKCKSYNCPFDGPSSPVPGGSITTTPGFLSIAELNDIKFSETHFNSTSKCSHAVFGDNNEYWVAWMDELVIKDTEDWFKNEMNLGGSALWLENYKTENEEKYGNLECDMDIEDLTITCKYIPISNRRWF